MSEQRKAFYTVEESEVGNLYYFAPSTCAAGPFKEQRHVEAIIDIDADGCLAGVELIDRMPAPPKTPTDATSDRVKQLEEALRPFKAIADAVFYLHDDGAEANADKPDHYAVWGFNSAELTYGDLRRVRLLLNGGSNERD